MDVVVVEDERLMRQGIQLLLEKQDEIHVVGLAGDGYKGVQLAKKLHPDVVVMDIHMPQLDGIQATAMIKEQLPATKVVLLTRKAATDTIVRALDADADGILLKEVYAERLGQFVIDAYHGATVFSGEIAKQMAKRMMELTSSKKQILQHQLAKHNLSFTGRQLDIIPLFMEGKRNKTIADILHVSEGTVKNYISDIYQKTGRHTRKDAITYLRSLSCDKYE